MSCDEIRHVRTHLRLTQGQAARLVGGGVNAFSRYERGETMQSRATDKLLRLLDKNPRLLKEVEAA